jgi:peroxiredoxin
MKKAIIASLALLALLSCSDKPKINYVINCKVNGAVGNAYLYKGKTAIDSTGIEKGVFVFKGALDNPEILQIAVRNGNDFVWQGKVFAEKGVVNVIGTTDKNATRNCSVSGTPSNDAYQSFNDRADALVKEFQKKESASASDSINRLFIMLEKDYRQANRNNLLGLDLLSRDSYNMDGQSILDSLSHFPEDVQASASARTLKALGETRLKIAPGCQFIEVNLADTSGKIIRLSDIVAKNKFVLLDFFASWSQPAAAFAPDLVSAYAKYRSKGFEIYGVSLDNNPSQLKRFIVEHDYSWPVVCDLQGFDSSAAKDYGIIALPSSFLIDSDGMLIGMNLSGKDVADALDKLLK